MSVSGNPLANDHISGLLNRGHIWSSSCNNRGPFLCVLFVMSLVCFDVGGDTKRVVFVNTTLFIFSLETLRQH